MSAPQITAGRVTGTRNQRAAADAAPPRIARAANLAVLRSLRSDTTELQGPLPARPVATTLAHLLSIAWAAAAAVVLLAAAFVLTSAADGVEVDAVGRTAAPSVFELAQGPAAAAVAVAWPC